MKYCSSDNYASQRWDDIHFPKFESAGSVLASQGCQVILVRVCDLLNQSMFSQSLQQPRHLMSTLAKQVSTKITIAKSADVKLALYDSTEKIKIIARKKIEPAITAVVIFYCSGDFVQVSNIGLRSLFRLKTISVAYSICIMLQ